MFEAYPLHGSYSDSAEDPSESVSISSSQIFSSEENLRIGPAVAVFKTFIGSGASRSPPECTDIRCKWIFKKKLKSDGSIVKFKARLVAKDFKQKEGIDYFDTYSLVARLTTIRVLIALVLVYNLLIHI
ncbi:Retrovirus-related Pol polyprotein from transposon RE2 [Sesamum angolense]|uniref:Retrovirus-related Pol polyprotein from transposon RE2 n=1 Tax=Sesamum angolense TaxID=2727404 RepID=A0AAE1VYT6_9LAMI|nr:Retrovirus-related Pol polyprotein from transposon RE2 [Sesamum angolense]